MKLMSLSFPTTDDDDKAGMVLAQYHTNGNLTEIQHRISFVLPYPDATRVAVFTVPDDVAGALDFQRALLKAGVRYAQCGVDFPTIQTTWREQA